MGSGTEYSVSTNAAEELCSKFDYNYSCCIMVTHTTLRKELNRVQNLNGNLGHYMTMQN